MRYFTTAAQNPPSTVSLTLGFCLKLFILRPILQSNLTFFCLLLSSFLSSCKLYPFTMYIKTNLLKLLTENS